MGMRPPQGIVSPMEAMMGGLMGTMNPMMAGMMHFMPGMPPIMGMMGPNAPMPGMQFMPGMAPPPPPPPRPPPRKMEEDDVKEEENGAGEEEGRSVKTESTDHEPKVEANIGDRVVSRSSNGSKAKDSNDRRRR
jgi:hypothetical protein